jgi:hypothetical protein
MPTVTGTLKRGNGTALETTLIFWRPASGISGTAVISADRVSATTNASGVFSSTLESGAWVVTWPKGVGGNPITRLNIAVPVEAGTYNLVDLIDQDTSAEAAGVRWFGTIAAMLASPAAEWAEGRTLNSYGTDGIRSGWDRLMKTATAAEDLADNGDDILETDDGLAFCVRAWIAG